MKLVKNNYSMDYCVVRKEGWDKDTPEYGLIDRVITAFCGGRFVYRNKRTQMFEVVEKEIKTDKQKEKVCDKCIKKMRAITTQRRLQAKRKL